MKKIIYAILGIFMMAACTDDHLEDMPVQPVKETESKVKLNFSVQIPEVQAAASRSFDTPAITTLQLAVFDANGYLSEAPYAVRAEGETGLGTDNAPIQFTVELSQTPNKRIIHFLANKSINANDFGTESELIGALYTTGEQDAYWQRIELSEGVQFEFTDSDKDGIYDNGETVNINTIGDKLTKVPLIRNFAKITVSTAANITTPGNVGFTLQGFTVVNVPDRGTVAPINTNKGGFAQYVDANKNAYSYSNLTGASINYTGFVPNDAIIDGSVADEDDFVDEEDEYTFYMYERNNQSKNVNRTFVIVKGQFGNEGTSYYKIDLTYKNGNVTEYFEILRNFSYNIVINNVESSGAASPELAATMTGSHNNLSASIETQSLLNISDGASRLFVNYTEYVFVGSGETMELKYRYVPNVANPNSVENENIDTDNDGHYVTYNLESKANSAENSVASITAATSDVAGWRTLTVTAAEMDANEVKRQTLTLVAGNLSRTVTFILRPKFNFSNEKATSPQKELKAAFSYSFVIPQGIPESLFPLTFIVQASPENIYPNSDKNSLPVKVLDGEKTFGYEREVTYEEYQQTGGVINCYFLVNTENFAGTKITVSNRYFNDSAEVTLREGTKITIQESDGNNDKILTWNTTATSIANQTVTVSLDNSSVTWGYSVNNNDFVVTRDGNVLTIKPQSTAQESQAELTIFTSDGAEVTIELKVVSNIVITIDAEKLKASGSGFSSSGIYGQTFNIYTNSNYTQSIGTCSFSRKGQSGNRYYELANDLTLTIPAGIDTLYFMYRSGNTRYVASISVDNLKKAANGQEQTLQFTN